MQIRVNDKPFEFCGGHVGDLLEQIGMKQPYFAVAVNKQIIPKKIHRTTALKDGDEVEIVEPVGGG